MIEHGREKSGNRRCTGVRSVSHGPGGHSTLRKQDGSRREVPPARPAVGATAWVVLKRSAGP